MKKKGCIIGMVLCLLAGICGCQQTKERIPELMEPVDVKLDLAEVQVEDIGEVDLYEGEMMPFVEELSFSMDGKLGEVKVKLGDEVKKGQILAVLDQEEMKQQADNLSQEITDLVTIGTYDDRLVEVDIAILQEELVLLQAEDVSEEIIRDKKLDIQRKELALRQTKELRNLNIQKKQNELSKLQENLGKNQIKAPFDGRIVYIRNMKVGDGIQAERPVFYIADESRIYFSTRYIQEGQIDRAADVYVKIEDQEYDITLIPYEEEEYVELVMSGEGLKSRFAVDAPEGTLECGQYGVVMVWHSYREDVLTIPLTALYKEGSSCYVYKAEGQDRIRCEVEVGIVTDIKAEIISGLKEGDYVYVKN